MTAEELQGITEELRSLAGGLRAREDRTRVAAILELIADDLERIEGRGRGRPEDPLERAQKRERLKTMADAIYAGTLAEDQYPEEYRLKVQRAKGSRTEADALTAEIQDVKLRTVQKARQPLDPRTLWGDFIAQQKNDWRSCRLSAWREWKEMLDLQQGEARK